MSFVDISQGKLYVPTHPNVIFLSSTTVLSTSKFFSRNILVPVVNEKWRGHRIMYVQSFFFLQMALHDDGEKYHNSHR